MIQNQHINLYARKKAAGNFFRRPFLFYISCIFIFLVFFSCRTTDIRRDSAALPADVLFPYSTDSIVWQSVGKGIDFFTCYEKSCGIFYEVVRIDLRTPSMRIFSRKISGGWQVPVSVKSFAEQSGAVVAVNTSPFYSKNKYIPWSMEKPCGLVVSEGKVLASPESRFCAVAFYIDKEGWSAKIFDSQNEVFAGSVFPEEAAGGFWTTMRGGEMRRFSEKRDFRAAAATASAGRVLYLLAGKNLTYGDCSVIFRELGADTAMQFDGGSSAQLVLRGKNTVRQVVPRKVSAVIGFSAED